MKKTTDEVKSQGIVENPEQFKTPVADTAVERPDAAEPQDPAEQTDTPAEDKSETETPSKVTHFLKEAFQILFGLVMMVALCYFIWSGAKRVYNHCHVESREHLTEKLDLVQYGNEDYQLRWADKHRKFSKRFEYDPDFWNDRQILHCAQKDNKETTVSLKTLATVTSDCIYYPDRRGVAACIDGHMQLSFWNLHTGKPAFEARFTVPKDYYDDEVTIQFEGAYCVLPTPDGRCLIDTNGNVLLHGFKRISILDDRYITTMAGEMDDWKESLYDARDMHCLLADKDEIVLTSVGIYYREGDRRYLVDSSQTRVITTLVVDDYSDEYDEAYVTIKSFHEPEKPNKDSGYKRFSMNDMYGVFDKDYHVVIAPLWENIYYLGDGYFVCQTGYNAVIINQKGEILPYRE